MAIKSKEEIARLSPMMQKYWDTKLQYEDCIVFYRLGDFYEMFYDDAIMCSKILDLTLTGRDCSDTERAPMCGIPAKAVDTYLARLLKANLKVAICEQLTEPTGKAKELVQRDVIRVMTPGTLIEENLLDEKKNNFIMSIFKEDNLFGACFVDLSTGEFNVLETMNEKKLIDEIFTISPSEIIANASCREYSKDLNYVLMGVFPPFSNVSEESFYNDSYFTNQFSKNECKKVIKANIPLSLKSINAMFYYLAQTQKRHLPFINTINIKSENNYMYLDANAKRNLELTETINTRSFKGSLLWVLDNTKTGMGARRLKNYINFPLQKEKDIKNRLSSVEELYKNLMKRDEICYSLNQVYDLERLCVKISYGSATPKDVYAIYKSLVQVDTLKNNLSSFKSKLLQQIDNNLFPSVEVRDEIFNCLNPDFLTLGEANAIKKGYNAEFDELKTYITDIENVVSVIENREREATGIKNLKVKYNNVLGYFIEILNSVSEELIPFRYTQKQTLSNCKRFITNELADIERKLSFAKDNITKIERRIFNQLVEMVAQRLEEIKCTGNAMAELDTLCSLAIAATKNNYVKPMFNENSDKILIEDGRHPVVEKLLKKDIFVPNNAEFDSGDNRTMIITGPNMAGKSTYMRQIALITLMAHMGSFVPAKKCEMCLVDKIFTRIGASDDMLTHQSTFMVEMNEVSSIINYCTDKSLILLDEVGRGTSTFDGMSIATSVMEYLSKHIKAKTLFSTHYHELTNMEGVMPGVKNYRINVKELNGKILFLRKIVRGSANKSFGIEVASMAGLPQEIIDRAKVIMKTLLETNIDTSAQIEKEQNKPRTNYSEVINLIDEIDLERLTPIESFQILFDLKNKINELKNK